MANLLTASVISTISGVVSLVFGFAANVAAARLLGAHGTGLVAFAIWFGSTAATVAGLGIQNTLLRYMGVADDAPTANGLARKLLRPFSIAAFAATFGMLAWASYEWSTGDREMWAVWCATAVFYLIFAFSSLSLGAARGVRDFSGSARQVMQGCLMQLPAVFVGAYLFGPAGAILGQMMRYLPSALALRKYVSGPAEPSVSVTPAMRAFGRNTWFSATIGLFIWTRIEFVFLAYNHEVADVGFFAVGMTLAGLVIQLPEQMSNALLPYFGRHHDNNDVAQLERSYKRANRWVGLFVLPICFGGAVIMSELLPFLFGADFSEAVPSATILLATASITALTILPSTMISAREHSNFFTWATPALAVLMVILLALVVPSGGSVGAAIVRAVIHTAWLALLTNYCWRKLSMAPPLLDLIKIALSAAMCALVAYVVMQVLGGVLGMFVAVIAAGLAYPICLRLTSAIPADDVEMLSYNLGSALPGPLAALAVKILQLITPRRKGEVKAA
jgi:O-antigen/teichoic acid export membrane protein